MNSFLRNFIAVLGLIAPLLCFGCSKEKLDEMVSTVKEKAAEVTEVPPVIAEVLPPTGKANIQLNPPVEISRVYASLYVIGDGRPNVLQWTSYDPQRGPDSFPAMLVRGTTSATTMTELAGQSIRGQVFLKAQSSGPVLVTSQPVDITLQPQSAETRTLDATVSAFQFVDAAGKPSPANGLSVQGVMQ